MILSHRQMLSLHGHFAIVLLRSTSREGDFWHYVRADKEALKSMYHQAGAEVRLADYGEIILCGWGENPPGFIQDYIRQTYLPFN